MRCLFRMPEPVGFTGYCAMDEHDRRILRVLERDGRISNAALAQRVALSPSACLRRVQALERRGIIAGYRAVLNRAETGRGFLVFVTINLADHSKASLAAFERGVAEVPEVRECHNVTGGVAYILRCEVADLAAYKRLHTDTLGTLEGVREITSYVVMEIAKDARG